MQSYTHTTQDDVLKGVTNEAPGQARARAVDEHAQLCELSNAMAVLSSALVSIIIHKIVLDIMTTILLVFPSTCTNILLVICAECVYGM